MNPHPAGLAPSSGTSQGPGKAVPEPSPEQEQGPESHPSFSRDTHTHSCSMESKKTESFLQLQLKHYCYQINFSLEYLTLPGNGFSWDLLSQESTKTLSHEDAPQLALIEPCSAAGCHSCNPTAHSCRNRGVCREPAAPWKCRQNFMARGFYQIIAMAKVIPAQRQPHSPACV